ncbi:AP-3 complex subunit sigma-2 isoform 2 [Schistosoma japonicum]|uniref:AP complex subunit sigma n=2 Tax=Schistosoma japonicum TaxID=6182 RepID=Q5DBZ1_SCHJA|nr:SJCHGC02080 protein [Schistosoma japonicum]KAH8861855.1 AP-3 complex subunit sigma-2 [Schistosoma japonicum]KAH8861859.1 AP-3 complex subunit sigma-2 [Schistosoma japonicum]TNN16122.1 AP-3 complex subunit sigma-2 isoform 2 [Schistosoma japonicum]
MIRAVLVINNHGKPRLIKFYEHYSEDEQQKIVKEVFNLVSRRDDDVCNFLEGGTYDVSVFSIFTYLSRLIGGQDYRLIYRHYATLYFVFCVDSSESELGILDLIQVFVEALDKCFENVCELDLIFHADKVHYILNELVLGGMVLETHINEITHRYEEQQKLEKQESGLSGAPARAVSAMRDLNLHQKFKEIRFPDLHSLQSRLSR